MAAREYKGNEEIALAGANEQCDKCVHCAATSRARRRIRKGAFCGVSELQAEEMQKVRAEISTTAQDSTKALESAIKNALDVYPALSPFDST